MTEADQGLRIQLIEKRMSNFEELTDSLKSGGGNGTSGGMEIRVASLEADVRNIRETLNDLKLDGREIKKEMKSDFRWLIAGIVGSFLLLGGGILGLAALMAHGFGWIG